MGTSNDEEAALAPPLRPTLAHRDSAANMTGGLDGLLRGAAMTFNRSSTGNGNGDDSSTDSSSSDEEDSDEDKGEGRINDLAGDRTLPTADQSRKIEKKLENSDEATLKADQEKPGSTVSPDGSGSLSSDEKPNPLEAIALTPLNSTSTEKPQLETQGSSLSVGQVKKEINLQSKEIKEIRKVEKQAESKDDWALAREKAALAESKEKKKRKALGRLIKRTKGTNDHHHPIRGLSMLDEDDHLIQALNSQAIDSLDEVGEESFDYAADQDEGDFDHDDDDEDSDEEKETGQSATTSTTAVNEEENGKPIGSTLKPTMSRASSKNHISPSTKPDSRKMSEEEKAEKLEALIAEFGESKCLRGQEEEKFLADCPAVLMRTVLIKGSLIVTSHRLAFVAFLPSAGSNSAQTPNSAESISDAPPASHPDEISPVLKKGPATVHRQGWHVKKKGWFELRADSITHYPSSDKLYHPIGSLRLDGIDEILPVDWKKPRRISMKIRGTKASLGLKTEEAALEWRRELEAALWNFRNSAEKIRICVPLERIIHHDYSSYLHFATVAHLYVMDEADSKDPNPDENSGNSSDQSTLVGFGITHRSNWILDVFREAFKEPTQWREANPDKLPAMTAPPTIEVEGPRSSSQDVEEEAKKGGPESLAARFVFEFSLRASPEQLKLIKADLSRTIPVAGTLAIGLDVLVFWRPRLGTFSDTKLKVPLADISGVEAAKAFRYHYYGIRVHIRGHPDLAFEFGSTADRDLTLNTLSEIITERAKRKSEEEKREADGKEEVKSINSENLKKEANDPVKTLLKQDFLEEDLKANAEHYHFLPKVVNSTQRDTRDIKPMNIVCLTIGSRGDVQPFIALMKGFKKRGHTATIVSHPEYQKFVESNGINFRPAGGDPGALMALSVEHKMFSPGFFRESIGQFREWLDELLRECWEQSQGADLIIESPQTFAGVHVAEALGAKFFRAAAMTWTRTSSYPQAFSVPPHELGASYNSMSYTLFDQVLWRASSGQINRWRKHMLGLKPTDLTKLQPEKVPFMYNFTENLVPFPNDWGDRVAITGYWELTSEAEEWKPPKDLEEFIEKAKKDGKKLCYIGFGSITVEDADAVTSHIYEAVKQADVRAIVAKGWSGRMNKKDKDEEKEEVKIPDECYVLDSIPHDWLFPRCDIALHHGGAGTTGASLRAGLVTLIKPFFGDQYFWASQVRKVGAGARVSSLETADLKHALEKAAKDRIMVEKAADIGEKIRKENGVENAIRFVYNNLLSAQRTPNFLTPKEEKEGISRSSTSTSEQKRRGICPRSSTSASIEGEEEKTTLTSKSLRLVSSPISLAKGTTATLMGDKDKSFHRKDTSSSSSTSTKDSSAAPSLKRNPSSRRGASSDEGESSGDQRQPRRSSSIFSSLPTFGLGHSRVSSITGALGAMVSGAGDDVKEEEEGEEEERPDTPRQKSNDDEKEDKKEPYTRKRAKAEDVRRRELLKERMEKEKLEKEGKSGDEISNTEEAEEKTEVEGKEETGATQ